VQLTSLANLLKDPPPAYAFELSEAGLAFARVSEPQQADFVPFESGTLVVSPLHDNIQQPQSVLDKIRSIVPPNGHRRRRTALILPDYCARISVLDFDNFPSDPAEQTALLRFRMKKSVPFDIDSAVISYAPQSRKNNSGKIEVLAAVVAAEIVARYEEPFRACGFHPGLVTTSSLAALNLVQPAQITMLVKLSGRVLSALVLDGNVLRLARSVELERGSDDEIEGVLHPTVAYIEDELESKPECIWLCGFGAQTGDFIQRWQSEWDINVEPLRARYGVPGPNNAGLLGYLESSGG